ncbi:hypothetical protein SAMN05421770_105264 [Granulicella rosea]|uniref:DUF3352 domain-containing protein n=1 Tax=Granulicella rosea TaxID=474952 RepID=A0A239KXZ5_9BACT|nr:hypothetical protein [Granulicella rosea]SNT22473.1 hypothetical protein SAMN05421770_105264 [Granulicella rosea]
MRKQTRYTLLAVLIAVAALAVVLYLRQKAPPEAARLLPESDAIVYVSLKPLRAATHFDRTPITRSPDFQKFIDATGIVPERDLDAAAFALHRMPDPHGPNGPVAFSEVFEGRFDGQRLAAYLNTLSNGKQETYAGHTIYTIPIEGRTLRIAQLGYDTIAASNMPTTEQIHAMLDRERTQASPFAGSSLLSARYADVPLLSSAWAIGHIGLPFAPDSPDANPNRINLAGMELPFTLDTDFVASLRFTTALHLRIEEIAPSEADAAHSAEQLTTILQFLKTLEQAQQTSPGIVQATESVKIEAHKDRAILTANLPLDTIKTIMAPDQR